VLVLFHLLFLAGNLEASRGQHRRAVVNEEVEGAAVRSLDSYSLQAIDQRTGKTTTS
jgi:hypothetical protein